MLNLGEMKSNVKGTWKFIINALLNKRILSLPLYFMNNDELIQNEQTIANELNSDFISFCSVLHDNFGRIISLSHTDYLCDPVCETLYFNPITENNCWKFYNY